MLKPLQAKMRVVHTAPVQALSCEMILCKSAMLKCVWQSVCFTSLVDKGLWYTKFSGISLPLLQSKLLKKMKT